ncbi:FAD-dependent monooxygenase [Nocardia sp. NPDC051463]|uniref:FAD-dependent monooxygenase n=1 Tax=Nocardia sp. NPDC051463 TaxID=3154845 RepID=UPI0034510FDA
MRNKTVLISGASVAGPALAYWLNRYGFAVTVVERAPALRTGGQAVDFKGETHRFVLDRMGIWDDIQQQRTGTTDTVFIDDAGNELAVMSGDFTGGDVEILRGDLAAIMYKKTVEDCEYLFGDSISALTDTADGVFVEFEHGPARTFDLVFGADGIHSRVRKLTFGPEKDFVKHLGHYYCVAGASPWSVDAEGPRDRATAYAHNVPGRLAVSGGSKAQQLYMFAAAELDYDRTCTADQRRVIKQTYADVDGEVPRMLTEIDEFEDVFLDSISKVNMKKVGYTKGRVALVGDSAYGNTLGGFGTGLAVVGAYVIAGELAVNDDHTTAFANYSEIMRRYTKLAGNSNAGAFLAPKTARGIKMRNWFLNSRMFTLMMKYTDSAAKFDLRDYSTLVNQSVAH